jgi:hypothetical protein
VGTATERLRCSPRLEAELDESGTELVPDDWFELDSLRRQLTD